jgi:hypothetical protein
MPETLRVAVGVAAEVPKKKSSNTLFIMSCTLGRPSSCLSGERWLGCQELQFQSHSLVVATHGSVDVAHQFPDRTTDGEQFESGDHRNESAKEEVGALSTGCLELRDLRIAGLTDAAGE